MLTTLLRRPEPRVARVGFPAAAPALPANVSVETVPGLPSRSGRGSFGAFQLDLSSNLSGGQDPSLPIFSRYLSMVPTRQVRPTFSRYPIARVPIKASYVSNGRPGRFECIQLDMAPALTVYAKPPAIRGNGLLLGLPLPLGRFSRPAMVKEAWGEAIAAVVSGLQAYELLADAGAYAITGADAAVQAARLLNAAAGAYTLTGAAAGLTAGRSLAATAGAYTVTGAAARLTAGRLINAVPGAYTLTGADVEFTYTPATTTLRGRRKRRWLSRVRDLPTGETVPPVASPPRTDVLSALAALDIQEQRLADARNRLVAAETAKARAKEIASLKREIRAIRAAIVVLEQEIEDDEDVVVLSMF